MIYCAQKRDCAECGKYKYAQKHRVNRHLLDIKCNFRLMTGAKEGEAVYTWQNSFQIKKIRLRYILWGLVLVLGMLSCQTKGKECTQLNEMLRRHVSDLGAAHGALMSIDQTVVAFGADKGASTASVVLEQLAKLSLTSGDVQPVATDVQRTLTDLYDVFAAVQADLKARDAARAAAATAGQEHAGSMVRLRDACRNTPKIEAECETIGQHLKRFPPDTAAAPALFHQQLEALKNADISVEPLATIMTAHVRILEKLGPQLIDAHQAEVRLSEHRKRSSTVWTAFENSMDRLTDICGLD